MNSTRWQDSDKRLFKLICIYIAIIAMGIGYGIFCEKTSLAIPCIFHKITGLKCPSCGVTTMAICLMHLDFKGAFAANPMIMVLLPFFAYLIYIYSYRYVKYGKVKLKKAETVLVYVACAALVVFGILRNII